MVAQPNNNTTGAANLVKKSNLKFVLKNNRKSEPFAATNTLKKVTIINNFSADDEVGFLDSLHLDLWPTLFTCDCARSNVPIECLDVWTKNFSLNPFLWHPRPPDVYNLCSVSSISFSAIAICRAISMSVTLYRAIHTQWRNGRMATSVVNDAFYMPPFDCTLSLFTLSPNTPLLVVHA